MTETKNRFFNIAWRVAALSAVALIGVQIYFEFQPEREKPAPISLAEQTAAGAPDPKTGTPVDDIWQPAETPRGGVSWKILESTDETTRIDDEGYIVAKPIFSDPVKELEGKRVKVAGWMLPIESGAKQKNFVLLGYPPGCPYHFHAKPNQFIEVFASTPFETDEKSVHTVTGVLELTGYDESGIFYRIRDAKPG